MQEVYEEEMDDDLEGYEELDDLGKRRRRRRRPRRRSRVRGRSISRSLSKLGQVITQPLYDSFIPDGSDAEYNFFSIPRGQSGNSGVLKTTYHTNMVLAGQLPTPQSFTVYGLKWICQSNQTGVGYDNLFDGYSQFHIADKQYLECPNNQIPIGSSMNYFTVPPATALDGDSSVFTFGHKDMYVFKEPLVIKSTHSFYIKTTWNTAPVTTATYNSMYWLVLVGNLTRSVS